MEIEWGKLREWEVKKTIQTRETFFFVRNFQVRSRVVSSSCSLIFRGFFPFAKFGGQEMTSIVCSEGICVEEQE